MEEVEHIAGILKETKEALLDNDSTRLRDLSNRTIHSASLEQEAGSITLAVIVYTLAKLIERGDNKKIKYWDRFVKKAVSFISLGIVSLKEKNIAAYESYLERIRKSLSSVSSDLKPYIQEVLRKAAINKASKMYEHGISMGQTARLLGISQWELSEYAGQRPLDIHGELDTESVKRRAALALEFFS